MQFNLPVSKQQGDFAFHGNAGLTWYPRASAELRDNDAERVSLLSPHISGSTIYRLRPMFNLMLESVLQFEQLPNAGRRQVEGDHLHALARRARRLESRRAPVDPRRRDPDHLDRVGFECRGPALPVVRIAVRTVDSQLLSCSCQLPAQLAIRSSGRA